MARARSPSSDSMQLSSAPASTRKRRHQELDEDSDLACYLCMEPIDREEWKTFSHKGVGFHRACKAAVRCHRRLLTDGMRASSDDAMLRDPAAWRADIRPLIVAPGSGRSAAARRAVKIKVSTERYKDQQRVQDTLVLNRRRFKTYNSFWDKQASEDASEDFDRLIAEQQGAHSTATEPKVAVLDNLRCRSIQGDRQTKVKQELLEGGEVGYDSATLVAPPAPCGRAASSAPTESSRGASATKSCVASERRVRLRRPTPASEAMRPPTTQRDLRPRASSDDGSNSSDSDNDDKTTSAPVPIDQMSPLLFMKLKDEKLEQTRSFLETGSGRKGIAARLRASAAKLKRDDVAQLDEDPTGIIAKVEFCESDLSAALAVMTKCKKEAWSAAFDTAEAAKKALTEARSAAHEQLAAIDFLVEKVVKVEKKQKNHHQHRGRSIASKLHKAGFAQGFAKWISMQLENMTGPPKGIAINPDQFQHDTAALFTTEAGADSTGMKIVTSMKDVVAGCANMGDRIRSQRQHLNDDIAIQGIMARLDFDPDSLKHIKLLEKDALDLEADPGAAPWVITSRGWSWRYGPSAAPCPASVASSKCSRARSSRRSSSRHAQRY